MKLLLAFLAGMAFCAQGAFGQVSPNDASSSASIQEKATLEQLHDVLRKYPDPHDTYIEIAPIGNEESVPLLLERLRLDYGDWEESPPSGVGRAFVCTRFHLINALMTITNANEGMYYPRWKAWWDKNRGLSQHQWIVDGFGAMGLHVSQPINEEFALELIEELGRYDDYRSFNAERLLSPLPESSRTAWVALASTSPDRFRRLGAIEVLRQIDRSGHVDLLRVLASDPDLEVRRNALTVLNDHLRAALSASPGSAHLLLSFQKPRWIRNLSFTASQMIVAFDDGRIQAFEQGSFQPVWSRQLPPGAGSEILPWGDGAILASQEGGLTRLNQLGETVWQSLPDKDSDDIRRLVPFGKEILVIRSSSIERVNPMSGAIIARVQPIPGLVDADVAGSKAFFLDEKGLHSLATPKKTAYGISNGLGVSVTDDLICVTSGGDETRITCLTPGDLTLQWSNPVGNDTTWGNSAAALQTGSSVLVCTNYDLTAFDESTGDVDWSTQANQFNQGEFYTTDAGFLIENNEFTPELRDLATGEVLRVWPQVEGINRLSVHGNLAAAATFDGALWLLDLDDPPPPPYFTHR